MTEFEASRPLSAKELDVLIQMDREELTHLLIALYTADLQEKLEELDCEKLMCVAASACGMVAQPGILERAYPGQWQDWRNN